MKQKIIMFVGISGVGKTTFLRGLQSSISFQHLTAGTLIAAAKGLTDNDVERDGLRLSRIIDNQKYLVTGFQFNKDENANLVILDGHAIVDTGEGLEEIAVEVFRELRIDAIVHLCGNSDSILANRLNDPIRQRPALTLDQIDNHQMCSLAVSRKAAASLDVPFLALTAPDHSIMIDFVEKLTSL